MGLSPQRAYQCEYNFSWICNICNEFTARRHQGEIRIWGLTVRSTIGLGRNVATAKDIADKNGDILPNLSNIWSANQALGAVPMLVS